MNNYPVPMLYGDSNRSCQKRDPKNQPIRIYWNVNLANFQGNPSCPPQSYLPSNKGVNKALGVASGGGGSLDSHTIYGRIF